MTPEDQARKIIDDQLSSGGEFTDEQMQWLVAIKDHIASSLMIEQDDFAYAPFNQFRGIGRVYELFGNHLAEIMEELNARLAVVSSSRTEAIFEVAGFTRQLFTTLLPSENARVSL